MGPFPGCAPWRGVAASLNRHIESRDSPAALQAKPAECNRACAALGATVLPRSLIPAITLEFTMKKPVAPVLAVIATLLTFGAVPAHAAVAITEVAPWSSGNSPVGADWFELTNTGATSVDVSTWKMDDSSASFGSAVALNGVATLAPGQSAIFIEGSITKQASFINTWFGTQAPAGLAIGTYSGSGVGLSTSGDAVNVFNAAGVLQASVTFGASPSGPTYASFDNAAGLTGAIAQLSVVGVHGAFVASNDMHEVGSPGRIAAVPEAGTWALMLAGLALVGAAARRRQA
jgi:hypothetical protein